MVAQILIVMIAAIAVTIFAERRDIQPPLLLAFVGLIASFIPGLGRLEVEPEIILTVVLPPLLFSAAREFSFVSFIRRLGSILNLGVFLVAVTTGIVGAVAASVMPGMTLAVALVLGAIVSPPCEVSVRNSTHAKSPWHCAFRYCATASKFSTPLLSITSNAGWLQKSGAAFGVWIQASARAGMGRSVHSAA